MSAVVDKIAEYYLDPANCADWAELKAAFLEGLKEYGTVKHAAERAGVHRNNAYIWRNIDPEFRAAWDSVLEDVTDDVEASLYRQASSDKNVVATIFYLKNNRHKYRDRVTIDVVGVQREVEEQLDHVGSKLVREGTPLSLPPVSAKDIVAEALGLRRGSVSSSSVVTTPTPTSADGPPDSPTPTPALDHHTSND